MGGFAIARGGICDRLWGQFVAGDRLCDKDSGCEARIFTPWRSEIK
ncbi:hypothetical protein QUB60_05250 [Microcoleus sp. A2-C5]